MKFRFIIAALLSAGLLFNQAYAEEASATAPSPEAVKAQKDGDAFLMKNKTKPGVVTLADGLQYKILKAGNGPKPGPTDTVTVEYSGKLIDGTEFDSSDKHGGSATFNVSQVIPGWVEALQLMPVGSTWELYIPSNLAYGEQGSAPVIGPNSTLIFKVTLVSKG